MSGSGASVYLLGGGDEDVAPEETILAARNCSRRD